MNVLVFQLHYGLHCPVVVVEVDGSHHFGSFQVSDLHRHFADGVAADEFHHLLGGGVPRVHLNGGELDVLGRQKRRHNTCMITSKKTLRNTANHAAVTSWDLCNQKGFKSSSYLRRREPLGCCRQGKDRSPSNSHQIPPAQTACWNKGKNTDIHHLAFTQTYILQLVLIFSNIYRK